MKHRVREGEKLRDFCRRFSAVRSDLMTDVSYKIESANSNCQMVANVITKHTAQPEQLPAPTPLCLQSDLSELVRETLPSVTPKPNRLTACRHGCC